MNRNEALGLPPGSIRAIMAIIIVVAIVAAVFVRGVVPETLGTLGGAVIAYYFNKQATNAERP